MNLRPVTLACKDQTPAVRVEQQPYPLDATEPDHWITTVAIGAYPNVVELSFDTATPKDGRDAAADVARRILAGVVETIDEVTS